MRSPALITALAEVGLVPCGDNSCLFGAPGGQGTNGGCRCFEKMIGWPPDARVAVRKLIRALTIALDVRPLR